MTIPRAMGGGALASPLQVPGCVLWLDAADAATVTADANGVSAWNDKSGNAFNVTQSNNTYKPTYTETQNGRNVITGTASKYLTRANVALLNNVAGWTFFGVFKTTNASTLQVPFWLSDGYSENGGTRIGMQFDTDNSFEFYGLRLDNTAQTVLHPAVAIGTSFMVISGGGAYGSTFSVYKNGAQWATTPTFASAGSSSNTGSKALTLGSAFAGGTFGLIGQMGEFIVYPFALPAATRIRIENYLRSKWGTG